MWVLISHKTEDMGCSLANWPSYCSRSVCCFPLGCMHVTYTHWFNSPLQEKAFCKKICSCFTDAKTQPNDFFQCVFSVYTFSVDPLLLTYKLMSKTDYCWVLRRGTMSQRVWQFSWNRVRNSYWCDVGTQHVLGTVDGTDVFDLNSCHPS